LGRGGETAITKIAVILSICGGGGGGGGSSTSNSRGVQSSDGSTPAASSGAIISRGHIAFRGWKHHAAGRTTTVTGPTIALELVVRVDFL